jgi:signal transduction histidine kinase
VSKRDFVTYISHEIRAPLNIVSLGMEMVTKDLTSLQQTVLPSLKPHIETLHDIGSSCSTATTILNELLLVHKIEGGNLSLNRELVNVADFITSVAKPFDVLVSAPCRQFCRC